MPNVLLDNNMLFYDPCFTLSPKIKFSTSHQPNTDKFWMGQKNYSIEYCWMADEFHWFVHHRLVDVHIWKSKFWSLPLTIWERSCIWVVFTCDCWAVCVSCLPPACQSLQPWLYQMAGSTRPYAEALWMICFSSRAEGSGERESETE